MVESFSDEILDGAAELDVAFLVVGDPFGLALSNCPCIHSLTIIQRNDTYRPRPTSPRLVDSDQVHSQCLHPQCHWRHRPSALQLWPNRVNGLLYRDVEAGKFL